MSQIGAAPCDRGVVAATEPAMGPVNGRLVLVGTVLGSSLAFIDGSAVNLTLPGGGLCGRRRWPGWGADHASGRDMTTTQGV